MKMRQYQPIALLFFFFLFNQCHLELPLEPNLTANFDMDKTTCTVPCTIQFTNKSTGSGTLTYDWSFGNAATSTAKDPSYTYTVAGIYTVTLTVKSGNQTKTVTKTVTISPIGSRPLAAFTYAVTNGGRAPCVLTVTNNSLNATKYSWPFGDGTLPDTNKTVTHTYTTVDKFELKLTASNNKNESDIATAQVVVKPTACFAATCNGCIAPNAVVAFDASCSLNAGTYTWNFSDPTSSNNTSDIPKPSHTYLTEGAYTVSLIVTKNGVSDTSIKTVTVTSFTKDTTYAALGLGPGKRVLTVADGYMVAGTVTSGANTNIYILKVDFNLNVVAGYPKMLTTTGINEVGGFIQLTSGNFAGNFAIAGSSFNTANNTYDVLYIRTNALGVLATPPTLFGVAGTTSFDKANNIIETQDGNVAIVGYTLNTTSNTFDPFIIKKSPDLNLTFINKIIPGPNDEVGYSITNLDNNSGFMIVGTTAAPGGSKPSDVLFIKTDATGTTIGTPKTFGTPSFYESAFAVTKTATGNLMTGGHTTANTNNNTFFVQTDQNGAEISNYQSILNSSVAEVTKDIKTTLDGGFIIAGERNLDAFNAKVNAQGVLISGPNTFGVAGRDYFESVDIAKDGGFIFTGSKGGGLYLVKTNKAGKL